MRAVPTTSPVSLIQRALLTVPPATGGSTVRVKALRGAVSRALLSAAATGVAPARSTTPVAPATQVSREPWGCACRLVVPGARMPPFWITIIT